MRIGLDGGLAASARQSPWLSSAVGLADYFTLDRWSRKRIFVRHATPQEGLSVASTCTHESHAVYIEEGQHRAIAAAWRLTNGGTEEPKAQVDLREGSMPCSKPAAAARVIALAAASRMCSPRPLLILCGRPLVCAQQRIAYIRGVNLLGAPGGEGFWQVHGGKAAAPACDAEWRPWACDAEWRPWPRDVEEQYPAAELCSGAVCMVLMWRAAHWYFRRHRAPRVEKMS